MTPKHPGWPPCPHDLILREDMKTAHPPEAFALGPQTLLPEARGQRASRRLGSESNCPARRGALTGRVSLPVMLGLCPAAPSRRPRPAAPWPAWRPTCSTSSSGWPTRWSSSTSSSRGARSTCRAWRRSSTSQVSHAGPRPPAPLSSLPGPGRAGHSPSYTRPRFRDRGAARERRGCDGRLRRKRGELMKVA